MRDTRFLPSDGYLLRFDQDVADFGADTQFVRHELLGRTTTRSRPNWVLNLAARGGYIFGYGGEDVRLFDRFFLGGATLRGFKFAGVGPRDTTTDDALGGNLLYTATAELRFPLGLPEELRIFGRIFVDAGTLYRCRRQAARRSRTATSSGRRPASACPGCRRSARSRSTGAGLPQGRRGRDRDLPDQLRHPLLMEDGHVASTTAAHPGHRG